MRRLFDWLFSSSLKMQNVALLNKLDDLVHEHDLATNYIKILGDEIATLKQKQKDLRDDVDKRAHREKQLQDAVELFAGRANASPAEIAQLGLGTMVKDADGNPVITYNSLDDLKTSIQYGDKRQATEAKFRELKRQFQNHQKAVTCVLDELNSLTKKNQLSGADIDKVRKVRDAVSGEIRRRV